MVPAELFLTNIPLLPPLLFLHSGFITLLMDIITEGYCFGLWWVHLRATWNWLFLTQKQLPLTSHRSHSCSPPNTKTLPCKPSIAAGANGVVAVFLPKRNLLMILLAGQTLLHTKTIINKLLKYGPLLCCSFNILNILSRKLLRMQTVTFLKKQINLIDYIGRRGIWNISVTTEVLFMTDTQLFNSRRRNSLSLWSKSGER